MEYAEHPTDQQCYNAGLSRAGYKRAYEKQERLRREEKRIRDNKVQVPTRCDNTPGTGVPLTKLKAWQAQQQVNASGKVETEEKLRVAYAEFVAFGGFETVLGRDAAARLATLMGYTRDTLPTNFGLWLSGDEAKQRFMKG